MGSVMLFIFRSRLLLYSAVNPVQVVLSGVCMRLLCFVQIKTVLLICMCVFIVTKALLILSATIIVRAR